MANKFGIPLEVEKAIRSRDKCCVYCKKKMKLYGGMIGSPKDKATIEHLNHKPPFYVDEGLKTESIVICCQSCNSSRGAKLLVKWFDSKYCKQRRINEKTVARPVTAYLRKNPKA